MMAKVSGVEELGGVRRVLGPFMPLLGIIVIVATVMYFAVERQRDAKTRDEIQKRIDIETSAWKRACAPHRAIFRGGDWWCRDKDTSTLFLPEFLQ